MVDEKYPIHGKITFVFPDCCPIWFAGRPDEDEYPSIEGSRQWGMADECGRAVVADECPIFSFGRPARPHTHLFKFFFFCKILTYQHAQPFHPDKYPLLFWDHPPTNPRFSSCPISSFLGSTWKPIFWWAKKLGSTWEAKKSGKHLGNIFQFKLTQDFICDKLICDIVATSPSPTQ